MCKGQSKLVLDENERGVKEVKKLKPLGDDKIKDRTMVVAAAQGNEPQSTNQL